MRPKATTPRASAAERADKLAFVATLTARTVCAHCGKQPIEWHNPEHVELKREAFRISNLVRSAASLATIQAEIDRCTPLCRRCHMAEDGRLRTFAAKAQSGSCPECDCPPTRLVKGLCQKCHDTRRRRARGIKPRSGPREHCRRGHPITDDNVIVENSKGFHARRCKTCRRAYGR